MRPASERKEKYRKKIRGLVLPGQTAHYAPTAQDRLHLEQCVKREAITPMLQFHYVAFAEELLKHEASKRPEERDGIYSKWLNRGLDSATMITVADCIGVTIPPPPPPPPCSSWLTEEECLAAGCYWWDDLCHEAPKPCEDFTTYTEIDPLFHITVAGPNLINFLQMTRDEKAYVYKDYGAGYFSGDFTHTGSFEATETFINAIIVVWGLANQIGCKTDWVGGIYMDMAYYGGTWNIDFFDMASGTGGSWAGANEDTPYFWTITRVGVACQAKIYTDAARTNLVATINATQASATAYQYIYALSSWYTTGTHWGSGWIGELCL